MTAPSDREVAAALDRWRELDRLAELDWPDGLDGGAVAAEAAGLVSTLAAAVDAAPAEARGWFARELIRAGQHALEFRATVAPRPRRSGARPATLAPATT